MKNEKPPTKNKKLSFTIKAKVSLLCTILILTAVIFNYLFLVNASKSTIIANTEETMLDLATAYSQNVSNTVSELSESTNFLMNSEDITTYINSGGTEKVSETENFISMFININSSNEEVNLVDANGIVLLSSNSENIGKDISQESYFTNMVSTNQNSQSDAFVSDSSGDLCITFATPLKGGPAPSSDTTSSEVVSNDAVATENTNTEPVPTDTSTMEFTGAITTVAKLSTLNSTLSDISVGNNDSSYAYLIDSTGTIVFDPDTEKIGTKIENDAMNEVITSIQSGTIPESDVITYTSDGVEKYISYSIDSNSNWVLAISVEKNELLSSFTNLSTLCMGISVIVIIILTVFAYLFTSTITNPIKKITKMINKTAELDFTTDNSFDYLITRRDETGEMSRSLQKMRDSLYQIIQQINDASNNINNTSNNLNQITNQVNNHASDNSATAEELAASMEETAASTELIYSNIEHVSVNSRDINEKAVMGANVSTALINRATDLKLSTTESTTKTKLIYTEVKNQTVSAIEQSKAVEKINILAKTIKDIASQTSLLALNASIEAARAGEAGRGFSVVASEISSLADQSSNTVSDITAIILEVHKAVDQMTQSLEQSLNFLEKNVLVDYQDFMDASELYHSDAVTMNSTMKGIYTQVEESNTALQTISSSISEINTMISDASQGVSDVAENNTSIVSYTSNTYKMVTENTAYAASLKEIVNQFKL